MKHPLRTLRRMLMPFLREPAVPHLLNAPLAASGMGAADALLREAEAQRALAELFPHLKLDALRAIQDLFPLRAQAEARAQALARAAAPVPVQAPTQAPEAALH
jgi:hypothetical protein